MMFKLMSLQPEHLRSLLNEPMNEPIRSWSFQKILWLSKQPYCFSCIVENDIVLCGGLIELWAGRAYIWTVFSKNYEKYPVACFRGMKTFLETQPYTRLEMDTPVDFEKVHRRARMLGFQLECRIARKYAESGEDRSLWAWVRDT